VRQDGDDGDAEEQREDAQAEARDVDGAVVWDGLARDARAAAAAAPLGAGHEGDARVMEVR